MPGRETSATGGDTGGQEAVTESRLVFFLWTAMWPFLLAALANILLHSLQLNLSTAAGTVKGAIGEDCDAEGEVDVEVTGADEPGVAEEVEVKVKGVDELVVEVKAVDVDAAEDETIPGKFKYNIEMNIAIYLEQQMTRRLPRQKDLPFLYQAFQLHQQLKT